MHNHITSIKEIEVSVVKDELLATLAKLKKRILETEKKFIEVKRTRYTARIDQQLVQKSRLGLH